MSDPLEQCPFLNRCDDRCSQRFNLGHLDHAFHYCFDQYQACPVYLDLLIERRTHRPAAAGNVTYAPKPLVQITLPRRHTQSPAAA